MSSKKKFLSWLLISSVYVTSFIGVESQTGILSEMANNDVSRICYVILGLFVFGMVIAGIQSWNNAMHFKRIDQIGGMSQSMGLLGTIIGLVMMFAQINSGNLDPSDKQAVLSMMEQMSSGLATALNTTMCGIISSLALGLYTLVLRDTGESKS